MPVYYVDVKFQKLPKPAAMGVWDDLPYICRAFKTWGWRNNCFYNHCGDVEYIIVTTKDKSWYTEDGPRPKTLAVNTYNQRDMRRIAKDPPEEQVKEPLPSSGTFDMNIYV
jgi:hypothetical protein